MTTLSSLFIVCSHGRRSAHDTHRDFDAPLEEARPYEWCPGGRPATLEDLGGEKVWWCEEHELSVKEQHHVHLHASTPCRITERILIPLPQMVAK